MEPSNLTLWLAVLIYFFAGIQYSCCNAESPPHDLSVSKNGCAKMEGCFSVPSSCTSTADCDYLLIYTSKNNSVYFEMSSKSDWAAVGFNGGPEMDGTDAIICSKTSSGPVLIGHYAVHGYDRPTITQPPPAGLFNTTGVYKDGTILCRFNRSKSDPAMAADLHKAWYLIVASGPVDNKGVLRQHTWKTASDNPVNFSAAEILGASTVTDRQVLILSHAALMVLAWLGFATVGIFMARYMRDIEQKVLGVKVWFQLYFTISISTILKVHRSLMILSVFLTILGVILAFVYSGGWASGAGAHPVIGIIVLVLAAIQPMMAIMRPHPGEARRAIFNLAHRSVGLTALLLAVVNMFLGAALPAVDLGESGVYIMVIFCLIFVAVLVLEIYLYLNRTQNLSDYCALAKPQEDEVELELAAAPLPASGPSKAMKIRQTMLVVVVALACIVCMVMIVLIAKSGHHHHHHDDDDDDDDD